MTPFDLKECRKVLALLDDFLSEELTVERSREILDHLEVCLRCRGEAEERRELRSRLKLSWEAQPVPPLLGQRLRRHFALPWGLAWLRLAATILVAAFLSHALFNLNPGSPPTSPAALSGHLDEVLHSHFNCVLQLPEEGPPNHHVNRVAERLAEAFLEGLPQYQLASVHQCSLDSLAFDHYIFEAPQRRVSLLLEKRAPKQLLPRLGGALRRVVQGVQIQLVQKDPMALAALQDPEYFVYLVVEKGDPAHSFQMAALLAPVIRSRLFG